MKYAANAVKLLPPVPKPGEDPLHRPELPRPRHRGRQGRSRPSRSLFGKFPNTLIGHGDPIVLPKVAQKVDYEAELVIVIGKTRQAHPERRVGVRVRRRLHLRPRRVAPATGSSAARRSSGSSARRSTPSPRPARCWSRADELPDPHKLQIQLRLNGTDDAELEHEGVHLRRAAPAVVPLAGA